MVTVTVATDAGDHHNLDATDGHPFWVENRRAWVDAADLEVGDVLVGADGERARVAEVAQRRALLRVHNLTVDGPHTYHVAAGDTAVLVHNSNKGGCPDHVRLSPVDAHGRATGAQATLRPGGLSGGTRARHTPPGFDGGSNMHRGHLVGKQLGGRGVEGNIVPLHSHANTPVMRAVENRVRAAVSQGETVNYNVTPIYRGSELVPRGITITAQGNRGLNVAQTILNIAKG